MSSDNNVLLSPDQLYGQLFLDVQLGRIFSDTKTFVDAVPVRPPLEIVALYEREKTSPNFNLEAFVRQYFKLPKFVASSFTDDRTILPKDHINRLWSVLSRSPDTPVKGSSRIPLPFPYVVPGGRFREIFYWDSYFTMVGLVLTPAQHYLVKGMIENFAYMIDKFGFVPNGNRTYYLSRSQPPFFAQMVQLLADADSTEDYRKRYLPQLRKEYDWWMSGKDQLTSEQPTNRHVVRLPDGTILNRYWDSLTTPRPESYPKEEYQREKAEQSGITAQTFYQHNRAACESGWDFSSRWLGDGINKELIRTTEIVPIDLNCLLYSLEYLLATTYAQIGDLTSSEEFEKLAQNRKNAIHQFFWNEELQFFMDYDSVTNQTTPALTLAGVYPLFFKLATLTQATHVRDRLEKSFLQPGGVVTSLKMSGQQWDWPNGWAPLQWIAYKGLKNYDFNELADDLRRRWLALNNLLFMKTGKMSEKYNVVNDTEGTGGNYEIQEGFGWTNGVYLRLLHDEEAS